MAVKPNEPRPTPFTEWGRSRTPRADFQHRCDPGACYRTRHLHYDPGKRFPVDFRSSSHIKSQYTANNVLKQAGLPKAF